MGGIYTHTNLVTSPEEWLSLLHVIHEHFFSEVIMTFCLTIVTAQWKWMMSCSSLSPVITFPASLILTILYILYRYAWTIVNCRVCRSHKGWKFTATSSSLQPSTFFGLTRNGLIPGIRGGDPNDLNESSRRDRRRCIVIWCCDDLHINIECWMLNKGVYIYTYKLYPSTSFWARTVNLWMWVVAFS